MRKQKASETRFLSIFDGFGIWEPSWPSKTEPRRSKIDVEKASKFDQFLKASWKEIFSAQEPRGCGQDAKTPQIAAEDGVGPGPVGEDLGGGSPGVRRQEPLG